MYRPIQFLDNNTYSFILMRNRSEELIEIPKEYIKSIEFGMGQYVNDPISLTMDVPSVIDRMGEKFEFPEPTLNPDKYVTCGDAISDLHDFTNDLGTEVSEYQKKKKRNHLYR